jgi:hypothetical protein
VHAIVPLYRSWFVQVERLTLVSGYGGPEARGDCEDLARRAEHGGVRALETVAEADGVVAPGEGWTDVIVTPERGLWTVDGLISGFHESDSSQLDMPSAAAGAELLARSYEAALEQGYLWHEFGDSHLIL